MRTEGWYMMLFGEETVTTGQAGVLVLLTGAISALATAVVMILNTRSKNRIAETQAETDARVKTQTEDRKTNKDRETAKDDLIRQQRDVMTSLTARVETLESHRDASNAKFEKLIAAEYECRIREQRKEHLLDLLTQHVRGLEDELKEQGMVVTHWVPPSDTAVHQTLPKPLFQEPDEKEGGQ